MPVLSCGSTELRGDSDSVVLPTLAASLCLRGRFYFLTRERIQDSPHGERLCGNGKWELGSQHLDTTRCHRFQLFLLMPTALHHPSLASLYSSQQGAQRKSPPSRITFTALQVDSQYKTSVHIICMYTCILCTYIHGRSCIEAGFFCIVKGEPS